MSKFVKGTLILLAAGFFTRILGFINRIAIARFIGEEGVGLYMISYPTFILAVTLTQMGLPVAISKRVAEAEAIGETGKVKKILVVSLMITLSLSAIFTPALFFGAPLIANTFFTDHRTMYPLIAIAPVVPIIAVSSVIRGYFQGKQNMKPAAISQFIEQSVRIVFIIILANYFLPYGVEWAAAAVMVATIIGELVSLLYLITMFKLRKAFRLRKRFFLSLKGSKGVFRDLMSIALPTMGSRMIGSVSWFLEPIVVTQSLAIAGLSAVTATKLYGALTGFAMPLLLLPSFITIAISTTLVPAISEAYSLRQYAVVEKRLVQSIKFCILTGALSLGILYVLAGPLMNFLYHSSSGTEFIKLMAPFFVLQYLQSPLQAALQALDLARAAMINSLIGNTVKLVVIFVLASKPEFGINGVVLAMIIGFVLVTFLHYATLLKVIPITFYLRYYIKTFIAIGIMIFTGEWLMQHLSHVLSSLSLIVTITFAMGAIFILSLNFLKVMEFKDIKRFLSIIPKG